MTDLWQRLKQRKLVQWTLAYLAGAWALLQVIEMASGSYGWPALVMRVAFGVVALGFIVMLLLAWYHGERGEQKVSGTELILISLVLAVGGAVIWRSNAPVPAVAESAMPSAPASSMPAQDAAAPAAGADKSIAVLPLVNLGGDPKDDYLGDGISEEVLNALSKLDGLKVIARASSFQFRGRDVDAAKVGRALNVRSLLSGTVQRAGDELRIDVELVDTGSGQRLWTEQYKRTFKNLFALEDDISAAVSKALAVRLGAAAGQPLVVVATANPRAHELVLRARQMAAHSDEASLNQAVTLYNQAIAEDPNYAAAWAGLASAYAFLCDAYRAPVDVMPAMKVAAEKAIALDPNLAEGHVFLGYLLMAYARDFPAALRETERAIALNPGSADAHMFMGLYLLQAEHDAAAARIELQTAQRLNPLNPWNLYTEMWAATAQGDDARVLELAQQVHRADPTFFYLSDPLVYAYAVAGRWKECVARTDAAQTAMGDNPDYAAAICHARIGDRARARQILAQLEATARTRYVDHSDIAAIHAALGDNDAVFAALDQAYRDRSQPLLNFWFLPWFKPLHDDPRYRALYEKIYPGPGKAVAR